MNKHNLITSVKRIFNKNYMKIFYGLVLLVTVSSCKKTDFTSRNDYRPNLQTSDSANLSISAVMPNSGRSGEQIQIFGYGFGNDPYKVSVTFGTSAAFVISVNPSQIVAVVPSRVSTGHVTISVGDEILKSNLIFVSQEN